MSRTRNERRAGGQCRREKRPGRRKKDEKERKWKRGADDRGEKERKQRGWEESWRSFMSYLVLVPWR